MKKVIFLLLFVSLAYSLDQEATSLYNDIKSVYGSKETINENINKPLTGVNQFQTVDGSTTFDAPMQCPSEEKAVVISFSQSGGDHIASVSVDTNLDGTLDYFYTTPNISGVCTNGIVSCQPGTWTGCRYYYWEAPDKKPRLVETMDTSKTGTCSCANTSCGITTLDQPLFSLIGGGIAQAIMRVDSSFQVSYSKWNGSSLELYGQVPKDCSTANFSSYGSTNPETYYSSQTPPTVTIADVAVEQEDDPYSPYSVISPISELEYEQGKTIGLPAYQECKIVNDVYSTRETVYENCSDVFTDPNGEKWCIVYSVGSVPGCGYRCRDCPPLTRTVEGDFTVRKTQKWAVYMQISYLAGDRGRYWTRIIKNDGVEVENSTIHTETTSCLDLFRVLGTASEYEESHSVYGYFIAYAWGKNHSYPPKYGLIYILKGISYEDDVFKVSQTNTCPSDCTLLDEWVCDKDGNNCIQTVKDGNPLNVSLQKQCFEYTTTINSYVICSDGNTITVSDRYNGTRVIGNGWFYIKRKYNCGTQNIEVDLSRSKYVMENTTQENQTISYIDIDGTGDSITFDLDTNTCLNPVCTVEVVKTDTSVFTDDTNRSQIPAGTTSKELELRTCINNNGVFSCPLDGGATLVEDCKCSAEDMRAGFEQAITSMEILNQASKDIICSSSPP